MTIGDFVITLVLLLLFTHAGTVFASLIFVQDVSAIFERHIFSASFGVALVCFTTVFVESFGLSVLSRDGAVFTVRCGLAVLLVVSCAAVPTLSFNHFLRSFSRLRGCASVRWPAAAAFAGTSVVVAFRALPAVHVAGTPTFSDFSAHWVEIGVGKLGYCGVTVMSVLAGFAAVTTPASFLVPYILRSKVDTLQQTVAVMTKRQKVLANLWLSKQRFVSERWASKRAVEQNQQHRHKSFTQRVASVFSSNEDSALAATEQECRGLQTMCVNNFLVLSEVCEALRVAQAGHSVSSKVGALFGIFLSVFAGAKVLQVFVSLGLAAAQRAGLMDTRNDVAESPGASGQGSEPASWLVELLIGSHAMRRIAALLNAFMMITAIRGFLLVIFRLSNRYVTISASLTVLLFSFAMCAFFVAQLLMMRQRMSEGEEVGVLWQALEGSKADATGHVRLHNACFAISFVATLVVRRFLHYSREMED
jgi:hypothetical protein